MDISFWKPLIFFLSLGIFGAALFPSQRETGKLYSESGVFDKARFYLERQYHQNPFDLDNSIRYLLSLKSSGDERLFEVASKKLLKIYPGNVMILDAAANFYESRMMFDKASVFWEEMARVKPKLALARYKFISYCNLNKEDKRLISFYAGEVKKGIAGRDVYYSLARLYALRGDKESALDTYEKIVQKYPEELNAKLSLADVYESAGKINDALNVYWGLLESGKNNRKYGLIYMNKLLQYKKGAEAISMLEEYVKKHPNDERVFKIIGELYYESGNDDKALQMVRSYHDKTGGDYHSHHVLGDILGRMGDSAGAREEYGKALELLRRDRK